METLELTDVTHEHARESGTVRLRTADGRFHIVPAEHFKPINPPERSRTYVYPRERRDTFENVRGVLVLPDGAHVLWLDGDKAALAVPGWMCVTLDIDDWTY